MAGVMGWMGRCYPGSDFCSEVTGFRMHLSVLSIHLLLPVLTLGHWLSGDPARLSPVLEPRICHFPPVCLSALSMELITLLKLLSSSNPSVYSRTTRLFTVQTLTVLTGPRNLTQGPPSCGRKPVRTICVLFVS